MTFTIIFTGLMVGIQLDEDFVREHKTFCEIQEWAVLLIFTLEVVLKFAAVERQPLKVLRSGWNTFDILIVLSSWVFRGSEDDSEDSNAQGSGSIILVMRLLRLLRVLKLLEKMRQLQIIITALIKGLTSIGYIGLLLAIVFYAYSILGIILFRDNDPWHFGSLLMAMLTLFQCSTFNDWAEIMYTNIYGCDKYGYGDFPYMCQKPYAFGWIAAIYFIFFEILGGLVLLTLFIGVVTISMDQTQFEYQKHDDMERRIEAFREKLDIHPAELHTYRDMFAMLDLDGSEVIDIRELRVGLESIGIRPSVEELDMLVARVDSDGNQEIDCAEFIHFVHYLSPALRKKRSQMRHKLGLAVALQKDRAMTKKGPTSVLGQGSGKLFVATGNGNKKVDGGSDISAHAPRRQQAGKETGASVQSGDVPGPVKASGAGAEQIQKANDVGSNMEDDMEADSISCSEMEAASLTQSDDSEGRSLTGAVESTEPGGPDSRSTHPSTHSRRDMKEDPRGQEMNSTPIKATTEEFRQRSLAPSVTVFPDAVNLGSPSPVRPSSSDPTRPLSYIPPMTLPPPSSLLSDSENHKVHPSG